MQKIFILKGLPGSGKSTWAKELCARDTDWKRVNKDDLRAMIGCKHTKGNENFILMIRDTFIFHALTEGYSVIVDDTNFHPKHEEAIRGIATGFNVEVEVVEFATSIDECIRRDADRIGRGYVGEEVIRRMAKERAKWRLV